VLLDFGAARQALDARSKKFTAVLTEGYAPFEQYADNGDQGPWSDIYALGAVMLECLTGKPPVEAPRRASAKLRGLPDPLAPDFAALRAGVSAEVADAIEAALRVVEKERPQTVAAFRELIASPKPATVPLPVAASSEPAASPASTLIPDLARRRGVGRYPPPWHVAARRKPRRRARPLAFALVALAAAGTAAYLGGPVDRLAEGLRESARAASPPARRPSEPEPQAQGARLRADAQRPAQVPDAQPGAGGEDKDLGERRSQALIDHQQRQLDQLEEERRQALAAIRAAEAERERQRAAEAQRKEGPATGARTDPAPPPETPPPFRGFRLW
jgi:hypothetical protein